MVYPPRRLPTSSRRTSTSSTQSRPGPTRRGGRNLSLRHQQLESSVRSTVRKVALLEEMIDSSRLVEQHDPLSATNESRDPCEKVGRFHGLVIPQEPKPPESDGESLTISFDLNLILKGLVPRMLYVRMRNLRLRPLRGRCLDIQSITCFTSDTTEIDGDSTVGVAFTRRVFTGFTGCSKTFQHKF
jgi:hypothetical protein